MSERRRTDEMTDPGPPPEEALDATLRALGAPVPAQTRRTAESAGLDVAHYHAEPHRPPKAHEPPSSSKVATTEPMVPAAVQASVERDTIRMEPREQRLELTTVPRAAPAPSRCLGRPFPHARVGADDLHPFGVELQLFHGKLHRGIVG